MGFASIDELEVEKAQGAGRVQPVDVVLHVLGRVLAAHDPGGRVLELAPVRDHRRLREAVVLPRVVDVVMGVEDPPHVVVLQAETGELVLHRHLLGDDARHPEALHDLRVARARVHEDRVVAAEDEVPPGLHPGADAHVAGEDEEARFQLDVDQVELLDLEGHGLSFQAVRAG